MCDILPMPQPHLVISAGEHVSVISIADLRKLASGQIAISEFDEPDIFGRAIAIAILEKL
jgi:hypothetical protein